MKNSILVLMVGAVFLFTGCTAYGGEEQLMVVAFGVDCPSQNSVQLTVRVPSFSGSSDSGSTSDGYLTLTASASSFPAALNLLESSAPRTLNFSQTREIILGENTAPFLAEFLGMIDQMNGIRSQSAVALCKGSAEELINAQKAATGTRLSRYIDTTLETGIREGYIPDATLIRIMTQTSGGYRDALLAYVGKSMQPGKEESSQQSKSQPASAQSTQGSAGNMPSISGKQVEWMGAAALDGPNLAGVLTGFETALCSFLSGDVQKITFQTQETFVTLSPRLGPHLKITSNGMESILEIDADLNVLPALGMSIDLEQGEEDLEQAIRDLLTTLQKMRCDALGFGGIAIRQFSTLANWERSRWKDEYANAQIDVQVHFTMSDY